LQLSGTSVCFTESSVSYIDIDKRCAILEAAPILDTEQKRNENLQHDAWKRRACVSGG